MAVTNSFPPGAFPEHSLECVKRLNEDVRCILLNNNVTVL